MPLSKAEIEWIYRNRDGLVREIKLHNHAVICAGGVGLYRCLDLEMQAPDVRAEIAAIAADHVQAA